MIDLNRERLMSLQEVCRRMPGRNGAPISYETVRQWWKNGRRGVLLETAVVGGRRYTSEEALQRFTNRCTDAAKLPEPKRRRRRAKTISHQDTLRALEILGVDIHGGRHGSHEEELSGQGMQETGSGTGPV